MTVTTDWRNQKRMNNVWTDVAVKLRLASSHVLIFCVCACLLLQPNPAQAKIAVAGLGIHAASTATAPAGRNLYVLSIGVDKYVASQLNLRLANADAKSFAETVAAQGRGVYKNIYVKLLTDASVDDIQKEFETIIKLANPKDTFVLFYAGSGSEIVLNNEGDSPYNGAVEPARGISEEQRKSLDTILPTRTISDLKDRQNILSNSITGRQLTAYCSRILANRQILILDSCYSGASIPNVERLLLTKADRDGVGRNIAVIGLSTSEDELAEIGHGQLTKAVLNGLNGQADFDKSGDVTINELQEYVKSAAPKLGLPHMTPIEVALYFHGNDFVLVKPSNAGGTNNITNQDARVRATTRDLQPDEPSPIKTLDFKPAYRGKAVFFATNNYKNIKSLSNPIPDVEAIAKVLETQYGWTCEIHRDPTVAEIRETLKKYTESNYSPDDELMLYFAGHGSFSKDINHGFLAASDSPGTPNKDSWFSHSELVRYVTGSNSPHTLLIIDACFGATLGRAFQDLIETDFKRSSDADNQLKSIALNTDVYRDLNLHEYYSQIFALRPTQWCVVSGSGAVPDGELKQHSPFARKFLQTLSQGSNKLFLTRRDVEAALELVGSGPISSDIPGVTAGGPFVFLRKGVK